MSRLHLADSSGITVTAVRVATVRHPLEVPLQFGRWRITHREFALVRVDTAEGPSGFSYGLTRDGPVAAIVARSIAPVLEGATWDHPSDGSEQCRAMAHSVLSAGVGLRALSLVDIALWDAQARILDLPITVLLGGTPRPHPATSIIGYPARMNGEEVREEVTALLGEGWRRFKAPIGSDTQATCERLQGARDASPTGWLGLDVNYSLSSAEAAVALESAVRRFDLGWIEDPLPQGSAAAIAGLRRSFATPVAVGDDQGGSYYPESLLAAEAVDVLRVDLCTTGGVTGFSRVIDQARAAGVAISPHMFPHFHARVLDGLGVQDFPVEWGIPGAGVHPMDDPLERPRMSDGVMEPLSDDRGFGRVVSPSWLSQQVVDDPAGALLDLPEEACV